MLTADVLEQLTGITPADVLIVNTAWPALDVSSKLQVLQSYEGRGYQVPEKLLLIACRDPEPIVRYWACRYLDLPTGDEPPVSDDMPGLERLFCPSKELVQVAHDLRADQSLLVASSARICRGYYDVPPDDADHTTRLLFLHDARFVNFSEVVDWLERLSHSGLVPDNELAEVLWEFTASKWLLPKLPTNDEVSVDGYRWYTNIRDAERLWELTKTLPHFSAAQLAEKMPIVVEQKNIVSELMFLLPDDVQKRLMWRNDWGADELKAIVRSSPSSYPEAAAELQQLDDIDTSSDDEHAGPDDVDDTPDKHAVLLEALADLSREVAELRHQLCELTNQQR